MVFPAAQAPLGSIVPRYFWPCQDIKVIFNYLPPPLPGHCRDASRVKLSGSPILKPVKQEPLDLSRLSPIERTLSRGEAQEAEGGGGAIAILLRPGLKTSGFEFY